MPDDVVAAYENLEEAVQPVLRWITRAHEFGAHQGVWHDVTTLPKGERKEKAAPKPRVGKREPEEGGHE